MKRGFIFAALFLPFWMKAQTGHDSLALRLKLSALKSYPFFRPFTIEYDMNGGSGYSTRLLDQPIEKGRVVRFNRLQLSGLLPVYQKQKLTVLGGLLFTDQKIAINDVQNSLNADHEENIHASVVGVSLSANWGDSLWQKPLIMGGGIHSQLNLTNGIHVLSGLATATWLWKTTADKRIGLGLVAVLNPSAPVPVFPTLAYYQELSPSWELDVILPSKISLRRSAVYDGWVTLSGELTNSTLTTKLDQPTLYGRYEQNITALRGALSYEKSLHHLLFVGVKGGLQHHLDSRLRKVYAKPGSYLSETQRKMAPFLTVGISYLPPLK